MSRFSVIHFDSAGLPPAQRLATFAAGIVNFELAPDPAVPFAARADAWKVGGLVLSSLTVSPLIWRRSDALRRAPARRRRRPHLCQPAP
ncbi:MAG: hypothetical protein AB1942_12535 [Pseudomonadota bacterium]